MRRLLYPLLTGYTCLGILVTATGVVILAHNDPDASLAVTVGFGVFTLALLALTLAHCRPLRHAVESPDGRLGGQRTTV